MIIPIEKMEDITIADIIQEKKVNLSNGIHHDAPGDFSSQVITGWKKHWIRSRIRWHIFILALRNYRSFSRTIRVVKQLMLFKKNVYSNKGKLKFVYANRKYYFGIYAPGFPSLLFDKFIEGEFNRIIPLQKSCNRLQFIFFAITKKCPLRCEHCFEWDNLNKQESLSLEELKKVVNKFQQEGISQFHLSGGEPMVRMKDLELLIHQSRKSSEFWVLTSGFNFTEENASKLKQAGATGVVISLDHYDPMLHNSFRNFEDSHQWVVKAIRNARVHDLVTAVSICVTRSFISQENLLRYAEYVKQLGVPFIQILEPKPVGNYKGKDVTLSPDHCRILEEFYTLLNFESRYADYPVIIYHGYHQRRIGCMAGGNRNLYIDSEGYVNACPFCHTKTYNIKDVINNEDSHQAFSAVCPLY